MSDQNLDVLERYSENHDPQYIADDAVFTDMSSGQEYRGRDAIAGMLHWFYHVAFDAKVETVSMVLEGDRGAAEGLVVGRHVGEFAGVPATNKEIRVPLAVHYEFRDGKIAAGRFYFSAPAFLAQVGALPGAPGPS
jgi:steroid delta-isomerase-like uncharacterized protein